MARLAPLDPLIHGFKELLSDISLELDSVLDGLIIDSAILVINQPDSLFCLVNGEERHARVAQHTAQKGKVALKLGTLRDWRQLKRELCLHCI